MKIAVIARSTLSGNTDAISRLTEGLLRNLSQQFPQVQFFLITSNPVQSRFVYYPNITAFTLKPSGKNPLFQYWWYQVSLAKAIKKIKPDVLFSTDGQTFYQTLVPRVTMLWSRVNNEQPREGNFFKRHYHLRYGLKSVQSSDKLITFLESNREPLGQAYQVSPERLRVIYPSANPVFKEITYARQVQVREELTQGESYFLLTGSLEPGNSLNVILQGFALLKEKTRNDLKLVVVGSKSKKNRLLVKAIKQTATPDIVLLPGPGTDDILVNLYGAAVGTIYLPGLADVGLPVLEAQACGSPVISLPHGLLQEIAGNNALVIAEPEPETVYQAMAQVYHDLDLRAQLKEKGLANSRKFTWTSSSLEVMKMLEEVNKMDSNALALL